MYDLIGDIHGHAIQLKRLLQKMDYKEVNGVWQHSTRKAIFVGDYIDRGPAIRETLHIVHAMVTNGKALAILGNHEYNAMAYATQLPDGSYLRAHNERNSKQHGATLRQFKDYEEEWAYYLQWFYTLPVFLQLDGLRAVHACWDQDHIDWLKSSGLSAMNYDLLLASHKKGSKAYDVINETLKGKEIAIPQEHGWFDKDGHLRTENRIKWWCEARSSYGEFLFNCPEALRGLQIDPAFKINNYPTDEVPVFCGHYWLSDQVPALQSGNVVCLDYSIAKGGHLVAYRWNRDERLSQEKFVVVE